MKITNAQTVLNLWASSVRPALRMFQHKRIGSVPSDDRRIQARVKVETTEGFFKAKPVLWAVYVNESSATLRDRRVCTVFLGRLQRVLDESPIIVEDEDGVANDFYVTLGQAVALLAGYETPVNEKTIRRWCKEGSVMNYERGRYRYVRWSDVSSRAPKRKKAA